VTSMTSEKINEAAELFIQGQTKKPTAADLISHLEKKFPSVDKKMIETICSSHIPIPDPLPSVISSKLVSPPINWYSYKSKKHHNFRVFFEDVLDLPIKAKNNISASSRDLVNLLPNPSSSPFKPISGLVIGNVQSGKTANFTALIARAADSKYNLIVVLSGGNFNDLRAQTQKRIFNDLVDPVNAIPKAKKWHKGTNLDVIKSGSGDVGGANWDRKWDFTSENCIIVTKKNVSTLGKLGKWLSDDILPKAKEKGVAINLFLIDDEADHASLNLVLSQKKPSEEETKASRINKEVRTILHGVPNSVYIGFTASPFANMFVPPSRDTLKDDLGNHILTLFPRNFIYLLPEPKGYFGLKKMCPEDVPKFTKFLSGVGEKEAVFYRENTEKKNLKEAIKTGLKTSLFDFFIAIGIQFIRNGRDPNFHQSMLIHTKETKRTMHGILDTVTPFVERIRDTIFSGGTTKETKAWYGELEARYKTNSPKINSPPNFTDLIESLREYFSIMECMNFPEVLEISSDEDKGNDLKYPENQPYAVIAIGAARLSRGFTLENLYTTYFVREPKTVKSDTLLQQGRWFGFRGGNEDLVNIHMTSNLRDHFWKLKVVEEDLHDTIRHFQMSGLDPSYYAVPVMKAAGQFPTDIGKIPKKRKEVYGMLSGDYLPKTAAGFPINIDSEKADHEQKNLDNLEVFGELVDKMIPSGGKIPTRTPRGNYVFDKIPLDDVVDFFKDSLDNFINDPYNKKFILEYLEVRKKSGTECSSWTVAIVGKDPGKGDLSIRFGSSSHTFDLNLIQRSRAGKGIDDLSKLPQVNDFAISSSDKSGTTMKTHCGKRDSKNPILLVYLVDKNSKPKKDESSRATLGTSEHIVALSIGFPLAELTNDERKKYNSEKWWNNHLKLE